MPCPTSARCCVGQTLDLAHSRQSQPDALFLMLGPVVQEMSDTDNPVARRVPLKKARLATEQLVLALNEHVRAAAAFHSTCACCSALHAVLRSWLCCWCISACS